VSDPEAQRFIGCCLGDWDGRPGAAQLLDDAFLLVKKQPPPELPKEVPQPEPSAAGEEGGEGAG
jgi:hypothetical protein